MHGETIKNLLDDPNFRDNLDRDTVTDAVINTGPASIENIGGDPENVPNVRDIKAEDLEALPSIYMTNADTGPLPQDVSKCH